MFNNRRTIEKWTNGPKGFAGKANRQLTAIEQRLPGVAVGRQLPPDHAIIPGQDSFWAKITGSTADGTNKWTYAGTEQERTATGWQDKSGGRTFTGALNSVEANNSGAGVQGNSIDVDGTIFDDNTALEVQPVEGNPVVRMWVDVDSSGDPAYSFEYNNAIDGECA